MAFRGDDRGVSTVIGAVLLFAIIVVLLATYQSQVVPNQNRAAEFDHSNAVQNDMVELRNALLTAKTAGRITFAEVKLGTTYPNRVLAVNPPPAAGTLRTGNPRPITVSSDGGTSNICPSGGSIQSRTLRYRPGYNVYQDAPEIVYENTVLYLDFGDRKITLTDEELVRDDGDIVDIVPLNTSFDAEGINTESIEPLPGNVREQELTDATLTLPTNLSESTWEELLAEDLPASNVTVSNDNLTIETGGDISVACSPLGVNAVPAGGSRVATSADINPVGPNDVQIRAVNPGTDNKEIDVRFNNTGSRDTNITRARFIFYNNNQDTGGGDIGPLNISGPTTTPSSPSAQVELLGPGETLDPSISLPGNGTSTDITFRNVGGEDIDGRDFFIVEFRFDNGRGGTYFIDPP